MSKKRKSNNSFLIYGLVISLLFFNCESPKTSLTQEEKTKLISSSDLLLTNWHKAAADANFENYFGAMDSISVFIGTDATENWTKTDFANFSKPYFDRGKAWSFSAIERNIYANDEGTFVWFDELLETWMGLCRGSGVIENSEGRLKIKHYVLSVTVPNDDIQALITLKKVKDSILTKQLNTKILE